MNTLERKLVLDVFDYSGHKLCTLYDSQSDVEGQASNVIVQTERNGWRQLSFSIPSTCQTENGTEPNFRLDYIKADYKIRLLDDSPEPDWFFITQPQTAHNGSAKTVTVNASHVSQLLKVKNLGLQFNDQQGNNVGTCDELVTTILQGTGWKLGKYDTFYEQRQVNEDGTQKVKVRSLIASAKTGAFKLISNACELFDAKPIYHGDSKTVDIIHLNPFSKEIDDRLPDLQNADGVIQLHYGKNVKNITRTYNTDNIITKLIAYGAYGDATTGYCDIGQAKHVEYEFRTMSNLNDEKEYYFQVQDAGGTLVYHFKPPRAYAAGLGLYFSMKDPASMMYLRTNDLTNEFIPVRKGKGADTILLNAQVIRSIVPNTTSYIMNFDYYRQVGLLTDEMIKEVGKYQSRAEVILPMINEKSKLFNDEMSQIYKLLGTVDFCKLAVKSAQQDEEGFLKVTLDTDEYDRGVIFRTDYSKNERKYFTWRITESLDRHGLAVNTAAAYLYILRADGTQDARRCFLKKKDDDDNPKQLTFWIKYDTANVDLQNDDFFLFATYGQSGKLGVLLSEDEATIQALQNATTVVTDQHPVFFSDQPPSTHDFDHGPNIGIKDQLHGYGWYWHYSRQPEDEKPWTTKGQLYFALTQAHDNRWHPVYYAEELPQIEFFDYDATAYPYCYLHREQQLYRLQRRWVTGGSNSVQKGNGSSGTGTYQEDGALEYDLFWDKLQSEEQHDFISPFRTVYTMCFKRDRIYKGSYDIHKYTHNEVQQLPAGRYYFDGGQNLCFMFTTMYPTAKQGSLEYDASKQYITHKLTKDDQQPDKLSDEWNKKHLDYKIADFSLVKYHPDNNYDIALKDYSTKIQNGRLDDTGKAVANTSTQYYERTRVYFSVLPSTTYTMKNFPGETTIHFYNGAKAHKGYKKIQNGTFVPNEQEQTDETNEGAGDATGEENNATSRVIQPWIYWVLGGKAEYVNHMKQVDQQYLNAGTNEKKHELQESYKQTWDRYRAFVESGDRSGLMELMHQDDEYKNGEAQTKQLIQEMWASAWQMSQETYWKQINETITTEDAFVNFMKQSDEYKNASETKKEQLQEQYRVRYKAFVAAYGIPGSDSESGSGSGTNTGSGSSTAPAQRPDGTWINVTDKQFTTPSDCKFIRLVTNAGFPVVDTRDVDARGIICANDKDDVILYKDYAYRKLEPFVTSGDHFGLVEAFEQFQDRANEAFLVKLPALKEQQKILSDLEEEVGLILGDIFREGYWQKDNYVKNEQTKLYEDALKNLKQISRPETKYQIGYLDLYDSDVTSQEYEYQFGPPPKWPDLSVRTAVHLVDPDMDINTWAYIDKLKKCYDQPWKTTIDVNTNLSTIGQHTFTDVMTNIANVAAKYKGGAASIYSAGSIGAGAIQNGAVSGGMIANGAVTGGNIATGTVTGGNIASGTITGGNIASGTITGDNIATGSVPTSAIMGLDQYISTYLNGNAMVVQMDPNKVGQIVSLQIGNARIDTAQINNLYAGIIDAVHGRFETLDATQLKADVAKIAMAQIDSAFIDEAYIDKLHAEVIEAVDASFKNGTFVNLAAQIAQIAKAEIDWADINNLKALIATIAVAEVTNLHSQNADIQNLWAKNALIDTSVQGKTYITNLAVTDATMVSLTAGQLMLKAKDGSFVKLVADGEGGVTTQKVQVENDNLADDSVTGSKIVENSITARELNVESLFAKDAYVLNMIASNITANEAFIQKIHSSMIQGDGSLTLKIADAVRQQIFKAAGLRLEVVSTSDVLSTAVKTTTLTARVWRNNEIVTDEFDKSCFNWKRTSNDSFSDEQWNQQHKGMKSITLSNVDVLYSATYDCELVSGEDQEGYGTFDKSAVFSVMKLG